MAKGNSPDDGSDGNKGDGRDDETDDERHQYRKSDISSCSDKNIKAKTQADADADHGDSPLLSTNCIAYQIR